MSGLVADEYVLLPLRTASRWKQVALERMLDEGEVPGRAASDETTRLGYQQVTGQA